MTHTSDTHTYTHTAPSPCIADPAAPFSACSGRPGAETPAGVKRCLYAYRVYLAWHAPDSVAGLRVCKCRVQVVQMPRSSPRLCSCTHVSCRNARSIIQHRLFFWAISYLSARKHHLSAHKRQWGNPTANAHTYACMQTYMQTDTYRQTHRHAHR